MKEFIVINRIETFIGEWLDSEQVDYGEKIRFSVQIQESLLTASLKNNNNNNNNSNYANGGGIVNSPLKNVQNSLNGSGGGGVSLRSSNSSNNQNGSNTNTDPVVESRINKLNKFFGEMIHPSQLGSSTDSSPSVVSTSPNPPTSTTSTTLATPPPAATTTTTTTNNKYNNNNNNTHDTSTTAKTKTITCTNIISRRINITQFSFINLAQPLIHHHPPITRLPLTKHGERVQ
ncbi:hypothetical protein PPL_03482 [Heterostelium album PN500]|uniref:Uncharacterized protein n=1 Tax=Heterostelium pallidum (strain ATCC 26659 / Pp 5 / PN500) TaxID=670386 RepID=D3B506_HETP5|nr:hypothetical protein PPL_03482 [Heterostelium album PN500]EFA84404.1 hypothetical protein PPL_03482 [Heterostelium album PN500]|eukprot:XP_020436518.1 hypothetical protein PPL_03482 [Heterostelium album PN500]